MVALLLASLASAGTLVTSVAAGFETALDQQWGGIDVALWPNHDKGTAVIGRVQGGYHLGGGPLVNLQVGFLTVLPEDEAILRAGLVAKVTFNGDLKHYPIDLTGGDYRYGLLPVGMGHLEFDFGGEFPHAVGAQAGWGPRPSNFNCTAAQIETECMVWVSGFHGGFFARKRFKGGFALEGYVGTSNHVTIGKAW